MRMFGVATVLAMTLAAVTVNTVAEAGPPTLPLGRSLTTSTPQAPAGTPFQITYDNKSFAASLPPSSVATYTWTPGSTVSVTETETDGGSLTSEKLEPQPSTSFGTTSPSLPTVNVNSSIKLQTITGFGGAMTDSSAFLINHSPDKSAILKALFGSPSGTFNANSDAGFNMVRLPLGASDFIANPKPTCSVNIPTCYAPSPKCDTSSATASPTCIQGFSLAHDEINTIPVLKNAKALSPSLKIDATPWSAPGSMKNSGHYLSSCSGSADYLNANKYSAYAEYLTNAAKDYQGEGLPFSFISLQNEPQNCDLTYPTMLMLPSDQAKLSLDLSADLKQPVNGLTAVPQIMGYDHNWYSPGKGTTSCFNNSTYGPTDYPQSLLALPNAVSDIGYHSYCGNSSVQTALSSTDPKAGIYVTESTGDVHSNDQAQNLVFEVQNDLIDPIRNGASGSLYWNLALDQNCGPQFGGGTTCNYCPPKGTSQPTGTSCNQKEASSYGGCQDCRPMVTINNQTGTYTLNEDYYYWAQFSKFIKPGATRICSDTITLPSTENICSLTSSGAPTNGENTIDTVAFRNPNGSIVVVAMNTAPDTGQFNICVAQDSSGSSLAGKGFTLTYSYEVNGEFVAGSVTLSLLGTGGACSPFSYDIPTQNVNGTPVDVRVSEQQPLTPGVELASFKYQGIGQLISGPPVPNTDYPLTVTFEIGAGANVVTFTNGLP